MTSFCRENACSFQVSGLSRQYVFCSWWMWQSIGQLLSCSVLYFLMQQGTVNILDLENLFFKLTIYFAYFIFTCCSCLTVSLQSTRTGRSSCKWLSCKSCSKDHFYLIHMLYQIKDGIYSKVALTGLISHYSGETSKWSIASCTGRRCVTCILACSPPTNANHFHHPVGKELLAVRWCTLSGSHSNSKVFLPFEFMSISRREQRHDTP